MLQVGGRMMTLLAPYDGGRFAFGEAMLAGQAGTCRPASCAVLGYVKLFGKRIKDRAPLVQANKFRIRCEVRGRS
jgi:hypothetical protein